MAAGRRSSNSLSAERRCLHQFNYTGRRRDWWRGTWLIGGSTLLLKWLMLWERSPKLTFYRLGRPSLILICIGLVRGMESDQSFRR